MTNGKMLEQTIRDNGVSITFLANKMGKSRNRIYSIIHGAECTAEEIVNMASLLHMSDALRDDIFLSKNVIKNHD